ncbi:MAG: hypothetical protein HC784_18140 [Hydrococcus sp. CSU_1_8]|nr:hypothetical protein [Hydrococcus sp. CSU_1_8]
MLSYPSQLAALSCPGDTTPIYFRNTAGSSINLVADDAIQRSYVPNLRISDFKNGLYSSFKSSNLTQAAITRRLASLSPNFTLTNKINLHNGEIVWAIAPTNLMPKQVGLIGACGRLKTNSTMKKHGISLFYADSMTWILNKLIFNTARLR